MGMPIRGRKRRPQHNPGVTCTAKGPGDCVPDVSGLRLRACQCTFPGPAGACRYFCFFFHGRVTEMMRVHTRLTTWILPQKEI